MNRRNQILTCILVLQLILGLVVLWPRSAASGGEGTSLFAGVEAGVETILVLTGVTGREDVTRFPYQPSRIVESVADIEP